MLNDIAVRTRAIAKSKGWARPGAADPEVQRLITAFALIDSEVAEAIEAVRHGNPSSEKCPEMSLLEEELADVIIRALDLCADLGYDADAIVAAKLSYNETRPMMHGGKAV